MTDINDEWAQLDAFLAGEFQETVTIHDDGRPPEPDALSLRGQDDANRAGRKLAALEREAALVAEVVQAERDRIAAYEADRMAGINRRRDWIRDGLEAFMRMEHERRGVSSVKLPTVTLSLRKLPDRLDGTVDASHVATYPKLAHAKPVVYELDRVAAKKAWKPGPVLDDQTDVPEGYEAKAAVDADGATVAGVRFLVPMAKKFDAKLTEADDEPSADPPDPTEEVDR